MEGFQSLSIQQVLMASILILANGFASVLLKLNLGKTLIVGGVRAAVQLSLLGYILSWVFSQKNILHIALIIIVMTLSAAHTAAKRSKYQYSGLFIHSLCSICLSSWALGISSLNLIINIEPWYQAQYLIPFLGMLLGNSLTGISLGIDHLTTAMTANQEKIETLISLGASSKEAAKDYVQDAIRMGIIPITNSMTVAGIVSLPGMMTGQILAGADPFQAALYQILILFLVAASTFFGTFTIVWFGYRQCFNPLHQFSTAHLKLESPSK